MARTEKLDTFLRQIDNWARIIDAEAISDWTKNTLEAMGRAMDYAPVKTGALQGSALLKRAKRTANGIRSAFLFRVPYAKLLEKGRRDSDVTVSVPEHMRKGGIKVKAHKRTFKAGKINISTKINPKAQSGYAQRGVTESEDFFIRDLKRAISRSFDKI